jgi:lipopolysaccharide biosynthesis glycosyltransferase
MAPHAEITCFLGYDTRETVASYVAAYSIRSRTHNSVDIKLLKHKNLRAIGMLSRPWLVDGSTGDTIDLIDGKKFSTEYSHSRFLVPALMNYRGWALYCDADIIFLSDIKKLFELKDDRYAVMCVKHNYQNAVNISHLEGRSRLQYFRKNWSSFMLINCAHAANRQLTVEKVNFAKGEDLHGFTWLEKSEIGEIPKTYNYISGISPKLGKTELDKPIFPDSIHYTEGGPWSDKKDVQFADLWINEYEMWCRNDDHGEITGLPRTNFDRLDKKE